MGKLIVIEGSCDGVGKSTQYKLLIDRLINEKEYDITSHHFPSYGTYQGRPVEEYLKGNFGNHSELSPYFVNSLYAQDRAITWVTGLKSEYDNDVKEREAFIDYVYDYEYHKLGIPEPDLVIFLHAPFEITRNLKDKRKDNDGIKNDIHERDLEFMKKVSDTSIYIAKKYNWDFIECTDGTNMRSIEDIHNDVYNLVKKKIKK